MSAEENKALVRRFVEAQANADLDTLDELLAPDFVDHSLQADQEPGREGFIRSVAQEPTIFSNLLSERFEGGRGLSATLVEELERFTGEGWEQEDDITLLTLERSASRS